MATLTVDLRPWLERRFKRQEEGEKERQTAQLLTDMRRSVASEYGYMPPPGAPDDPLQAVPNLAGVNARTAVDTPEVALRQQLANEDAETARQGALPMVNAWQRAVLAAQAGLNPAQLADAADQTLRTARLTEALGALAPAAQVDAVNAKSVAPVGVQGGVAFNRYDTAAPILGEAPSAQALGTSRLASARAADASGRAADASGRAADALARERDAARRLTGLRAKALEGVIGQPGVDPLLAADVGNANTVSTPQRVKVADPGGAVYYDATRRPDGGYDYTPAAGPGGAPVKVPAGEAGDAGTTLQKDTAFISQTLGITPQDAILYKLQSRSKSADALWSDIGLRIVSSDPSAARNPDRLRERAQAVWSVVRPGEALPSAAPGVGGGSSGIGADGVASPTAGGTSGAEDPRYAQARDAVARGADPEAVRARLRGMGLDPGRL